jgi:hypothetical protein
LKVAELLEEIGVEPPDEKDIAVFNDVLDRHFYLKPAEGQEDVFFPASP